MMMSWIQLMVRSTSRCSLRTGCSMSHSSPWWICQPHPYASPQPDSPRPHRYCPLHHHLDIEWHQTLPSQWCSVDRDSLDPSSSCCSPARWALARPYSLESWPSSWSLARSCLTYDSISFLTFPLLARLLCIVFLESQKQTMTSIWKFYCLKSETFWVSDCRIAR